MYVGSGVSAGNACSFLPPATGCTRGSALKFDGRIANPVDAARVRALRTALDNALADPGADNARRNIDWYHRKRRMARLRGNADRQRRAHSGDRHTDSAADSFGEPGGSEGGPRCGASVGLADSWQDYRVCPTCHLHAQWPARARIESLADKGTFEEINPRLVSVPIRSIFPT